MRASVPWPPALRASPFAAGPKANSKLDLLPPGPHERTVLIALPIVRAFVGKPATMPSADFRAAITALAGPFSPVNAGRGANLPR